MKKILVRAPRSKELIISSFPFFHGLNQEFSDAQINVITDEGLKHHFELLPLSLQIFELPQNKDSIMGIHHFSVNLHDVFNIDLFFDLNGDFKSSFLGRNFKAKERVGFISGMNKILLTHKVKKKPTSFLDRVYLDLLGEYLKKDFSTLKIGKEKEEFIEEKDQLFKEPASAQYILVLIDFEKIQESQLEFWKDFFNAFDKQKFIFWSFTQGTEIENFFSSLDDSNTYFVQKGGDYKVLNNLFLQSTAVVANEPWANYVASYHGKDSVIFLDDPKSMPNLAHFKMVPVVVQIEESGRPLKIFAENDKRDIRSLGEVVDFMYELLKL